MQDTGSRPPSRSPARPKQEGKEGADGDGGDEGAGGDGLIPYPLRAAAILEDAYQVQA